MVELREALILLIFCVAWSFLATPKVAQAIHEMQWVKPPSDGEDYVAKARIARCGVYSLCASIPLGSHIAYPLNWLAVLVAAPAVFVLSWNLLRKLGA